MVLHNIPTVTFSFLHLPVVQSLLSLAKPGVVRAAMRALMIHKMERGLPFLLTIIAHNHLHHHTIRTSRKLRPIICQFLSSALVSRCSGHMLHTHTHTHTTTEAQTNRSRSKSNRSTVNLSAFGCQSLIACLSAVKHPGSLGTSLTYAVWLTCLRVS